MKPSGPGIFFFFFFLKIFDHSLDFHACDGSVKIFYFFPGSDLEDYNFLKIVHFIHCPFYLHKIGHSSFLRSFEFLCCLF